METHVVGHRRPPETILRQFDRLYSQGLLQQHYSVVSVLCQALQRVHVGRGFVGDHYIIRANLFKRVVQVRIAFIALYRTPADYGNRTVQL